MTAEPIVCSAYIFLGLTYMPTSRFGMSFLWHAWSPFVLKGASGVGGGYVALSN
jgi:hypothetical protein